MIRKVLVDKPATELANLRILPISQRAPFGKSPRVTLTVGPGPGGAFTVNW